jgi:hypothetical protein
MTANQRTEFTLLCDGGDGCPNRYGPKHISRSDLRRQAAEDGWTWVRARLGRGTYDNDFCPQHKPVSEASR